MFPCLPTSGTLLRKQNLLPRKQKYFPRNSETFLLRKQCFLVFPHVLNASSTRNIVFPSRHVQTMFKDYRANINNTLRLVRANVSQQMFPNLPTMGNTTIKTSTGNNIN